MSKLIFAKDARQGDFVRLGGGGNSHEVKKIYSDRVARCISLFLEREGRCFFKKYYEDSWLELLHRPWPEGKTEADMRMEVVSQIAAASMFCNENDKAALDTRLPKLREAIEARELGKPLEEKKPAEDDCGAGRCAHAKTAAGMCGILALTTPTPRDC